MGTVQQLSQLKEWPSDVILRPSHTVKSLPAQWFPAATLDTTNASNRHFTMNLGENMHRLVTGLSMWMLAAGAQAADDCRFSAQRTAEADIDGVKQVIVRAGAGELHIEGESGRRNVQADAQACAPREGQLERLQLRISREGDALVVATEIPEGFNPINWFVSDGWLDLTLKVPTGMSIDVEDSSGTARISKVGATRVTDGSGDLTVENIRGSLTIGDGSGQITIGNVQGPVRIADGSGDMMLSNVMGEIIVTDDGSGEISAADVQGSITVGNDGSGDIRIERVSGSVKIEEDGSGDIFVHTVKHDVTIHHDGSGEISVAAIEGDFSVDEAGSGGIKHEQIGGRVKLAGEVESGPE